jgi:hypothetical protein
MEELPEDDEEYSKDAWKKRIDDVPSEYCSPLQGEIFDNLLSSV